MSGRFSDRPDAERQYERMSWRAAGAQFYPGGAYERLQEISYRGRGPKGYRPTSASRKSSASG